MVNVGFLVLFIYFGGWVNEFGLIENGAQIFLGEGGVSTLTETMRRQYQSLEMQVTAVTPVPDFERRETSYSYFILFISLIYFTFVFLYFCQFNKIL